MTLHTLAVFLEMEGVMSEGLLIIDMQNDYFDGGAMALPDAEAAVEKAALLLAHFRNIGLPVFHIQHISNREGAGFFLPGTFGCEINERVAPLAGEPVIQKNYPSSFQDTVLAEELSRARVDELVVCGAMSQMCIDTTVRSAFERGYKVNLIADACAAAALEFAGRQIPAADVHGAYMAALGMVFARVLPAAEYLQS